MYSKIRWTSTTEQSSRELTFAAKPEKVLRNKNKVKNKKRRLAFADQKLSHAMLMWQATDRGGRLRWLSEVGVQN